MLIYGKNPAFEALKSARLPVQAIYIQKEADPAFADKIRAYAAPFDIKPVPKEKKELDKLAKSQNHQGIVLSTGEYDYQDFEDLLGEINNNKLVRKQTRILIAAGLNDPHNLGALARSALGSSFDGIILPEHGSVKVNETVIKSSAGAILSLNVCIVKNLTRAMKSLKDAGLWIYGLDLEGECYCETDLTGDIALVVGSEEKGMPRLVRENCDRLLTIPTDSRLESLNASVAAGIVMFETLRQQSAAEKIQ